MRSRFKSVARFAGCVLIAALALVGYTQPTLAGAVEVEAGIEAIKGKDYEAAYKILLPEAEAGNARAQFAIGVMYVSGNFVAEDVKEGVAWYRRAAAGGYKPAFTEIGFHTLGGDGVEKDFDKAYAAFVAAGDDLEALYALAEIHRSWAMIVPKRLPTPWEYRHPDPKKAVAYYLRAARGGMREAAYFLAEAYCRGLGVAQNMNEAFIWEAMRLLKREVEEGIPGKYLTDQRYWKSFECPPHGAATRKQQAVAIAAARARFKAMPKEPGIWD